MAETWTYEQVATLKDLTAKGYSAGQIAPFVGHSRNAVIGKWHRMGDVIAHPIAAVTWTPAKTEQLRKMWISGHPAREIAAELGISIMAVQAKIQRTRQEKPFKYKTMAQIYTKPAKKKKAPPIGATVKFRDLKDSNCRYIEGDPNGLNTLFCANERLAGMSYCEEHARMCYAPVARRLGPFLFTPSNPALAARA